MRLENKIALITGGTSGIGEATAILFAQEGAKVTITGRNEKRGLAVTGRIVKDGGKAIFIRADVRRAEECNHAVGETLSAFQGHVMTRSGTSQRHTLTTDPQSARGVIAHRFS